MTATGALVGTPGYMAPEQCFGERDVDHRADIWSIGAILYEALSGTRPVDAENVGQMVKALMTDGIVPLSERRRDLPGDLTSLVDRMLSRDRDERPGDLRSVYEVLARRGSAVPPTFGAPLSRIPPPSGALPVSGVTDTTLASAPTEYPDAPARK